MTPLIVALIAIAAFTANLVYVLRPGVAPAPLPTPPHPRWVRRHYSALLSLARGTLNGTVATISLIQVGYPTAASLAEGVTAGLLSGLFQVALINERLAAYLNRASGEVERLLKWAWIEAVFYGLVKSAGTLAGGGPSTARSLIVAYLLTVTFGCAQ